MMIRAILTVMNIKMSRKINSFLYFLKKIPLVKLLFKNINYSFIDFKKIISVLSLIYSAIAGPIGFALLFGLGVYLPSVTIAKGDSLSSIMFFILIFYFLFKLTGSELMDPDQEKFIIVKQMKMDPKIYSLSQIIFERTKELFSQSVVLSLMFKFVFEMDLILGIQISISMVMFSIFMEAFHLYIYKKIGFNINRFKTTRIIIMVLIFLGAYGVVTFTNIAANLDLFSFFTNKLVTFMFTLSGVLAFIYLFKYNRYWEIINEENNLEFFKDINETVKDINFQEVKLKDKDFDEKSLKENEDSDKEGYDYLNYIFFKRHKRKVYKPMIIKSSLVILTFILIFIINRFFKDGFGKDISDEIINTYTILVFVVYAICNSESIMKSLFYNCDRSLLRYGFYKEGDALLKMFFLRLKRILLNNMIPIILLCIGLFQLIYFNAPERISEVFPIIASTIILAILFSVHYIFMYYILQPFTTSLKMKSPIYSIINIGVYGIAYFSLRLALPATKVLPYIFIFSLIYISMAIILIYKKAPETFRVK